MDRREMMKLLLSGGVAMEIDPELLLWKPSRSKVFIPSGGPHLTVQEIIDTEIQHLIPHLVTMFERDDTFFRALKEGAKAKRLEVRPINIPLRMGRDWGEK